ncbi:MAG: cold shock domain-containing protein [Gammaproteobacteria bacterium]|nr:MAG: cold shock domain-containing protein [Gammaproteobacteria bacterium]RKZ93685.1 MAG: cold shock domain-containing protein [Gammaproteobacteria bacterium]RKZ99924.1 MAG: cold shock domain-containing protein [Gammaproteobacteria bacterium]
MGNTVNKGQLKRWNDRKGFGFIKPEGDQRDVFIHISALKGMSRRPAVGDTIYYEIQTDQDGKTRAVNARIDGVEQIQATSQQKNSNGANNRWLTILLIVVAALIYGVYHYSKS